MTLQGTQQFGGYSFGNNFIRNRGTGNGERGTGNKETRGTRGTRENIFDRFSASPTLCVYYSPRHRVSYSLRLLLSASPRLFPIPDPLFLSFLHSPPSQSVWLSGFVCLVAKLDANFIFIGGGDRTKNMFYAIDITSGGANNLCIFILCRIGFN